MHFAFSITTLLLLLTLLSKLTVGAYLPLEDHFSLHVQASIATLILAIVHVVGHVGILNAHRSKKDSSPFTDSQFLLPWITGWIMFVALLGAVMSGLIFLRINAKKPFPHFALFKAFHKLCAWVAFLMLLPHGANKLFGIPYGAIVMAVVIFGVAVQWVYRYIRSIRRLTIRDYTLTLLDDKFYVLKFDRPMHHKPAQMVYVNLSYGGPALGFLDWHPFTICSDPSSNKMELLIEKRSGWTVHLYEQYAQNIASGKPPPPLTLDGPFSTNVACAWNSPISNYVLIASGSGITPILGILHYLSTAPTQFNRCVVIYATNCPELAVWVRSKIDPILAPNRNRRYPIEAHIHCTKEGFVATNTIKAGRANVRTKGLTSSSILCGIVRRFPEEDFHVFTVSKQMRPDVVKEITGLNNAAGRIQFKFHEENFF